MLELRLARGIDLSAFATRTGFDPESLFADRLSHLDRLGLIHHTPTSIRLSDKGLAVADAVAAEFLADSD